MGIFGQIVGMAFVCIIMVCIGWTVVEYIVNGFEHPRKNNKKLQ